jgi:hypothetical protein
MRDEQRQSLFFGLAALAESTAAAVIHAGLHPFSPPQQAQDPDECRGPVSCLRLVWPSWSGRDSRPALDSSPTRWCRDPGTVRRRSEDSP